MEHAKIQWVEFSSDTTFHSLMEALQAPHTGLRVHVGERTRFLSLIENKACSPYLSNLTHLDLREYIFGDRGAKALAASPHLGHLTHLDLRYNGLSFEGAKALAASPHLGHLTHLNLRFNGLGFEGAKALAASPHLSHLTHLDLSKNNFGNEAAKALTASPNLVNVTELNLFNNNIGNEGAKALAASPHLVHLTHLDLSMNEIGNEGTKALATSPYLVHLTHLDLACNSIGDEGAKALAASPHLVHLTHLDLAHNSFGDEGAKSLLAQLIYLQDIVLKYCDLSAPLDVCSDLEALQRHYQISQIEEKVPLRLIRTMLIGAPGVGKTLLFEAVTGQYRGIGIRQRTQGFQRGQVLFEDVVTEEYGPLTLTLDLWDLGGHSLQYMIHSLFFRRDALYLLVLSHESVKNPQPVEHWLKPLYYQHAAKHHRYSITVLPVLNPHKGHTLTSDQVEPQFTPYKSILHIKDSVPVRFSENCDIHALRVTLGTILQERPIETYWQVHDELGKVVDTWPENYLGVREFEHRLKSDSQTQATFERFRERLPESIKFSEHEFYRNAVKYLDHVGVVTVIKDYIILNPSWVSDGLYTLLPPSPLESEEDAEVPVVVKRFRQQLQSKDTEIGLPGVFKVEQVTPVFERKGYGTFDGETLLSILSEPAIGLAVDLAIAGHKKTYLIPYYLDEFSAKAQGDDTPSNKEPALADAIMSAYSNARVCYVIESTYLPEFILYQFMAAFWPRLNVEPHQDTLTFYTNIDLSVFHRRRIQVQSYDQASTVEMILYQKRIWCLGFSDHTNGIIELIALIKQIKGRLQDLIVKQYVFARVTVQRWIPCPTCMAAIPKLKTSNPSTSHHDYLQELQPGSGLFLNEDVESAGKVKLKCGHKKGSHALTADDIRYALKSKSKEDIPEVDLKLEALLAIHWLIHEKKYSLGDLFRSEKRTKIRRGELTALRKMRSDTANDIVERWSKDASINFQRDVRKTLNINKLPRTPTQLNQVLIDYVEALKRNK